MDPSQHLFLLCVLSFLRLARGNAVNFTVDDASGEMTFTSPPNSDSVWQTEDSIHSYNNTLTQIADQDAMLTFEFNGTAVYLVGSDWKFGRPFMANLDGKIVAGNVTGSNLNFEVESTPYWGVTDLPMGRHLLNVITMDADNGTTFAVDAMMYTAEEVDGNNTTNSTNPPSPTNPSIASNSTIPAPVDATSTSKSSTTAILGGTIGGAGALLLALFLSIKFKINIIGNLHLGTWRPFSSGKTKMRIKSLDMEAGSFSSSNEKAKLYNRQEDDDAGLGDYDNAVESNEEEDEDEGEIDEDDDEASNEGYSDEEDNEDPPPRRRSDAPEVVLQTAPVPKKRQLAPPSKPTSSRTSSPSRMSPQVATARPRRNDAGSASPTTRPIAHAGRSSRPSSPSSATGRSSHVSSSTAGSNLRYSSYEDEPLMSSGGNKTATQGRDRRQGRR